MTFFYSKSNGKAKLITCAIDKLQILLTNVKYTAVPTTTNFIATNGLPEKDETDKTTTVEATCFLDNSTSIRIQTNTKRKQSSAMSDNARLAARRMTRATSSTTTKDVRKRPSSNAMTRIQNVRRNPEHFRMLKVYFLVNNVDLRSY